MPYYYFGSSLPGLSMESPPPFSMDAFLEQCDEQLSAKDLQALDELLGDRPSRHPFVREWQARETQLRNALARIRASRLQRNADGFLREHDDYDLYAEEAAEEAYSELGPLERERFLDQFRWEQADELSRKEAFSAAAIFAYALKLRFAARWAGLDPEAGSERVEAIVSHHPDETEGHRAS
jgi:hypothetical protein